MSAELSADESVWKNEVSSRLVSMVAQDELAVERAVIGNSATSLLRHVAPLLPEPRAHTIVEIIVSELTGFGALEPLLSDPSVTEIMVNGSSGVFIERAGQLQSLDWNLTSDEILRIAARVIAPLGLRLDRSSPMVDARLPDGSRVHAVIPPIAIDGPCLSIRKFGVAVRLLSEFGVDQRVNEFLNWAVESGSNILVSGGTSSGKTSLLNSLGMFVSPQERVITIEETAELQFAHAHTVRLEARPGNSEGAGCHSLGDLVRTSLRMRPDRIVVGEVRGGECFDMLNALNTGHDGSMCTVHANSSSGALARVVALAMLSATGAPSSVIESLTKTAFDIVIQAKRQIGGARIISEISQMMPDRCSTSPIFLRDSAGQLRPVQPYLTPSRRTNETAFRGWFQ